ncbi:MAG: MiaB/RimO family radical SAM methylthiotransferase [Firmicutes bacterium]|nr:MiaB/RimO family radical SAM methylthiotransferase [Bacillota bacterium]
MQKIAVVTLGCDKNRVDTENMLFKLNAGGFGLTNDYASADAIIVNTCAFIESARKEAIDTILEMAEFKRTGNCKRLIVTGCLPQKYAEVIKDELPEVDAWLGVRDYDGICDAVADSEELGVGSEECRRVFGRLVGGDPLGAPHNINNAGFGGAPNGSPLTGMCAIIPNPEPRIPSPESRTPSPESRTPSLVGFGGAPNGSPLTGMCAIIPNPEPRIPNPESRIPTIIKTSGLDAPDFEKRILTTPPHYAYLRVSDGCDNRCAYCSIPSIRGPYRSRDLDSLVREADGLVESGVRELILVAQDVTRYGIDRYGEYKLIPLLKRLSGTGVDKIRLMYCYPELMTDELIAEISENPRIASYADIPFQHADDRILKLMNRRYNSDDLYRLMEKLRAEKSYIAVRTTLMVGFPSETDSEFENLCTFVKKVNPDHVGVFAYSREAGTPSAKLKPQIPAKIKRERVKMLAGLHLLNCLERNAAAVGITVKVTYEGIDYNRNLFIGRTEYNAPEIDTVVRFSAPFADIGKTYEVRVTGFEGYDLVGSAIVR